MKARDPMQDEFFQDQSIEDIDHALIRETIQNSLDAKSSDAPVRVVLSLGRLPAVRTNFWFPVDVQAHYQAPEIHLGSPPDWGNEDCEFLSIEDFGTKGLEGQIDSNDPKAGGNFYHFFRAEGVSNKQDGDRGSWGVGKIVIPRSSRIRAFFAITRRQSESGMHLIGQAILKHHTVGSQRFTPDGWFSRRESNLQVPYSDDKVTERLKQDFKLSRTDEPGLGVVIPWVYKEQLTLERLASVIAREYFIPILAGNLVIELRDHEGDHHQRFDKTSFQALKQAAPDIEQFQDAIQLAGSLLGLEKSAPMLVNVQHASGVSTLDYDWTNYQLDVEAQNIESALDHGQIVHFKVPMTIKAASSQEKAGQFDVLVKRKNGRHLPIYVRDELLIPNQSARGARVADCTALIHASNSAIADALRRAECPAHTDWKATRDKFKEQRYQQSKYLIPFVRESASRLMDKLVSEDGKPDDNLLAALLPLPSDDSPPQPKQGKEADDQEKEKKQNPDVDLSGIPSATPRFWRLLQSKGEIRLLANPNGFSSEQGYRLTLRAAYDLHGRNPFKAHSRFDFNLLEAARKGVDKSSDFRVIMNEGVSIVSGDHGTLEVQVTNPKFEIIFQPADLNRDLIMKITSSAIGEPSDDVEEIEE
ncbi:hypothetical protein B0B31_19315 [Pseudomonas aeruginosa]|nr:hypothetical protein B0B31_19315 [Pseudomonas aeruginosa]